MINIDRNRTASRPRTQARTTSRRLFALGMALFAGIPGCSGNPDEVAAVPVSGTVTYQGKPLESGTIQFIPAKGRTASGKIEGGRFALTTYKEGDGAIPGKHAVGVVSLKEKAPARPGGEPEMIPAIDKKYTNAAESGLSAEVPASGKADIQIEIQ